MYHGNKYLCEAVLAGLNVSDVLLTPYLSAMFVCILALVLPPASPTPSIVHQILQTLRWRRMFDRCSDGDRGWGMWCILRAWWCGKWSYVWGLWLGIMLVHRCAMGASREMRYQRYQWAAWCHPEFDTASELKLFEIDILFLSWYLTLLHSFSSRFPSIFKNWLTINPSVETCDVHVSNFSQHFQALKMEFHVAGELEVRIVARLRWSNGVWRF